MPEQIDTVIVGGGQAGLATSCCLKQLWPHTVQARTNWRTTGAVPFGIMLRRKAGATEPIPFPTRPLKAVWMSGAVELHFAAGNLAEPYYGVVPPILAYTTFQSTIPALPHKLSAKRLTGIKFTCECHLSWQVQFKGVITAQVC